MSKEEKKKEKPVIEVIQMMVSKVLGKATLIHQCDIRKKRVKLALGARIKRLVSVVVSVKIKNKISIITLNLCGYKYRLYVMTGKALQAIKTGLLYVKAKLLGDKNELKKIRSITITKKQYKKMKARKDMMLGSYKRFKNKKKGKGSIAYSGMKGGPFGFGLGYKGENKKVFKKHKFRFA